MILYQKKDKSKDLHDGFCSFDPEAERKDSWILNVEMIFHGIDDFNEKARFWTTGVKFRQMKDHSRPGNYLIL